MKTPTYRLLLAPVLAGAWCTAATADWVQFVNETNTRLVSDPALGASDNQEKDYDWGDLNNNGWIDLVVARKQPFTSPGRRVNVLFMNERGVLVDRTTEYATASTVQGDEGFNTPTNDRDIRVVDVDNDGWLDVVTATTLSDGQPKHISHPRVYMNLGNTARGDWQGLRFENARIPQLAGIVQSGPHAGAPHAPRFCSVAAGDVTGNGYADLYFGDYDQGGGQTLDFNDRLLINDGNGFFADESTQRVNPSWLESSFGTQSIIADLNGNGVNDVVKVNSLGAYHTAAIYNNPNDPGYFMSHQIIQNSSTYFAMVGDLNQNGRLDIVIADDGNDRWRMNLGNQPNGQVNWSSLNTLSQSGFRSNIVLADLNNNSWLDILIADVDVDLGSCGSGGVADIYRHNGNPNNVNFTHDRGNIPNSQLQRTFDFAVFDLNGNGWLDVIAGRCAGTDVFINQPTFGIDFAYPNGRPLQISLDSPTTVQVELEAFGQSMVAGSATLHASINGGSYFEVPMTHLGGNLYSVSMPGDVCLDEVDYYFTADLSGGATVSDPVNAPESTYSAIVAETLDVVFLDDIEGSVANWSVQSDPSLTGGEWEQAVPLGTICCGGQLASPDGDASPSSSGQAFTTQNCLPGQFPGACNVQHGPTYLTSPTFNLAGSNAIISYDRWFFCSTANDPGRADFLVTQVSNDGGKSWVTVHQTGGTNGNWENASFLVSDYVTPTAEINVRFVVDDEGNNSITNAGIDNLQVEEFGCGGEPCPGDMNGDGVVNVSDLLILLGAWGPCSGCDEDLNGDGVVNVSDLLILLGAWGGCP
jgi:hypothetical protein